MINIKRLQREFNFTIKQSDLKALQHILTGYCSSHPIHYCYGPNEYDTDTIVVGEIYSTTQMIKETIRYNKMAKNDDLPKIPEKCFIIGEDIGGDPIVYNAVTSHISCFTELTWCEEAIILESIQKFVILLKAKEVYDETNFDQTIQFSINDINHILSSLNIVKNDIVVNFLSHLDIGIIISKNFNYSIFGNSYTSFLHLIYNMDLIIKKNTSFKNNPAYDNFLIFADTGHGFPIALNLINYSICLIDIKNENACIFDDIDSFFKFVKR